MNETFSKNGGNNLVSYVPRKLFGRSAILLKIEDGVLSEEQIKEYLSYALTVHEVNRDDINYLYRYVRGDQPILQRNDKIIRPEINNMTVENVAKYITDFKLGYIWGEPTLYIKNSNGSALESEDGLGEREKKKDTQVVLLNEFFEETFKHNRDKECGFWNIVAGVGYKCLLANKDEDEETPFKLYSLDPRNTFVVYQQDFTKEPCMAVSYSVESVKEKLIYDITIYTKKTTYTLKFVGKKSYNGDDFSNFEVIDLKYEVNVLGLIPIIEFNYDIVKQGGFEAVIPLLNNLNLLCSDRMNDVSQAVQWFMKFINVDISLEDFEKFKSSGAIIARSDPGTNVEIDAITATLDQSQIQVFKDDMITMIHILCKVPQRTSDAKNNTGESLIIGQGWADAESDAKSVESQQIEGEKKLLKLALKICKVISTSPQVLREAKINEIDIRFSRNRTDNLLVKTQGLINMLNAGVHPLLAFRYCGLFSDPQKSFEQSKPYLDEFYENKKGNKKEAEIDSTLDQNQNKHNQTMQVQSDLERKKKNE